MSPKKVSMPSSRARREVAAVRIGDQHRDIGLFQGLGQPRGPVAAADEDNPRAVRGDDAQEPGHRRQGEAVDDDRGRHQDEGQRARGSPRPRSRARPAARRTAPPRPPGPRRAGPVVATRIFSRVGSLVNRSATITVSGRTTDSTTMTKTTERQVELRQGREVERGRQQDEHARDQQDRRVFLEAAQLVDRRADWRWRSPRP